MRKLVVVLLLFLMCQVLFLYVYEGMRNVGSVGVDVKYSDRYHELRAKAFLTEDEYKELNAEIEDYKRRFDEAIRKDVERWKKDNNL